MKIPLFKIFWDNNDIASVSDVIKSGIYWTTGPRTKEFENKIAEYTGTKYAVSFSSGTTALHSALIAHGIKENDEVIVPSFSFIATANVALYQKAIPVFADIETKTFGLDPQDVERKITKKTKAILPVHYGGSPCLIESLREIADENNLLLIEDAAESIGAKVGDRKVGTYGNSAMFSFCQNKIITTGDGGVTVTDSEEVFEKLKLVRSHGRLEPSNYFSSGAPADYVTLGFNYRMSDITAALGTAQLNKIDKIINLRRTKAKFLSNLLRGIDQISIPEDDEKIFQVHQLYTVLIKQGEQTRNRLMDYLTKNGVSSKVYFDPIHLTSFYRNELHYTCKLPVTEEISKKALTLPLYPTLSSEEMIYIAQQVKTFFEKEM